VRRGAVLALVLPALACGGSPQPGASGRGAEAANGVAEARALLERGEADAALARLAGQPDEAEVLFLRGRGWVLKAATAPAPAATPLPDGAPRGAVPMPQEFKPDELEALGCFERAIALRPDHSPSHLAMAELLAPHALGRQTQVARDPSRSRRPREVLAEGVPAPGPDASPERVVREFRSAIQSDPGSRAAVEGLIRFGTLSGRPDDAESGLRALVALEKESADPRVRYGDFLLNDRKDPEGAIGRYHEALIWRASDPAIMAKIAEVYIGQGAEAYAARHYAVAEARFREAKKYVTDAASPQGVKLAEHLARLREIRGTGLR
jgi:tetratricopeptide (TPR) repeat protein